MTPQGQVPQLRREKPPKRSRQDRAQHPRGVVKNAPADGLRAWGIFPIFLSRVEGTSPYCARVAPLSDYVVEYVPA